MFPSLCVCHISSASLTTYAVINLLSGDLYFIDAFLEGCKVWGSDEVSIVMPVVVTTLGGCNSNLHRSCGDTMPRGICQYRSSQHVAQDVSHQRSRRSTLHTKIDTLSSAAQKAYE